MNKRKPPVIQFSMNKRLLKFELSGFIITSIAGTIQHFLYEYSAENKFVALFAPVNESPWEHLKLLFFPFLIFTIIQKIWFKDCKCYVLFSNYTGIVMGMWSTLGYFYTLNSALGGNNEWVNISSYFVGLAIAFIISYCFINSKIANKTIENASAIMLIITTIVLIAFTFKPPLIPLFQDPIDFSFGI